MTVGTVVPVLLLGFLALVLVLAATGAALRALSRLDKHRTVLVHAPSSRVWDLVSDLPTLCTSHAKLPARTSVEEWKIISGDGRSTGSVWRGRGTRGSGPFWMEVQIVRDERGVERCIRLRRDSLGTHIGLRSHSALLQLEEIDDRTTKLTWRLHARLKGMRLLWMRLVSAPELQARLLDLGLRSIKVTLENAMDMEAEAARRSPERKRPLLSGSADDEEAPQPKTPPEPPPEATL